MTASGEARQLIEALGERNQAERPGEQAFAPGAGRKPFRMLSFSTAPVEPKTNFRSCAGSIDLNAVSR
jgi:hypothetical protein